MDKIEVRKKPKQQRSKFMVESILEASARLLKELPYDKFTTNKVADKAGISVGSLYQYFPNKESILFELEKKEVNLMMEKVNSLLFEEKFTPLKRLYNALEYFFEAESAIYQIPIPFTSNHNEYSYQVSQMKESFHLFLKQNSYIEEGENNFKADYLVTLIIGIVEQVSFRKDIQNPMPWLEMTFNSVKNILDKKDNVTIEWN